MFVLGCINLKLIFPAPTFHTKKLCRGIQVQHNLQTLSLGNISGWLVPRPGLVTHIK